MLVLEGGKETEDYERALAAALPAASRNEELKRTHI